MGEIWSECPEWLSGDRFDAVMNYPLAQAILGFTAQGHLDERIVRAHHEYGRTTHRRDGAGFAAELVLMAALIYVPPLRRLFEEGPLPLKYWLFLMLYPPIMFLAEEARKAFVRRRERRAAVNA